MRVPVMSSDDAMRDADMWHDVWCHTWRRNGATKRWKRNPARWEVPVKYGLYAYDYVTNELAEAGRIHLIGAVEWCKDAVPCGATNQH